MDPVVSFVSVTKRYGEHVVFDSVSFSVSEGERIGVLGPNGAGKTTLLRMLVGEEAVDGGSVARRRAAVLGYVPQSPVFPADATVRDTVAAGQSLLRGLLARADELRHAVAEAKDDATAEKRGRELHAIEEEIERKDGWDPERHVARALQDFGLETRAASTFGSLSGGEQRRVALARALVSGADLLVLDEPTNHLDVETIVRLEERLLEAKATCIFVTHDRAFLDNVATRLLEVDRSALYSFEGDYADYLERKAERAEREAKEERTRRNILRRELAWLKRGVKAQRTKNKDHVARVKELAAERPREQDGEVEFQIPTGPRLGSTVLVLENVTKSVGGRTLIKNLSLRVEAGDRIGIVGPNGVGKTTLIKLITGEEKPDSGTVTTGPNTRFVVARQQKDDLDPELTVHAAVAGESETVTIGEEKLSIRAYLLRFLFDKDSLNMKVGRLSGGERSRVQLARMLRAGGNFVILDEPTNDLDLPTLRVLENALVTGSGASLVVSHDRAFLGQVATRILAFEEDGKVEVSDGGLDIYLERRARRRAELKAREDEEKARLARKATAAATAAAPPRPETTKKLSWKEQRELEEIETRLPTLEAEAQTLTEKLSDPTLYTKNPQEARRVGDELKAKQDAIAKAYARWEELESKR